jgi:hypothetical protein
MAITDTLTKEFLEGLEDVKKLLIFQSFREISFDQKGMAYFVQYQRKTTIVKFLFGPGDWDVEMIVYTPKGEFAFKELLELHPIRKWIDDNRYKQVGGRNVKNELLWFVELLKVSLPIIE